MLFTVKKKKQSEKPGMQDLIETTGPGYIFYGLFSKAANEIPFYGVDQ